MRRELTRERLRKLLRELARSAPRRGRFRVYVTGGATAVYFGWRESSLDIDLTADREEVFRDIQKLKDRLEVNIEFARPDDFVPPLNGSDSRHVPIETIGAIAYFHFDPYSQAFAKIVRGFQRDLDDARAFVERKLVDPRKLRKLVSEVPDPAYAKYPQLDRKSVEKAVKEFVAEFE